MRVGYGISGTNILSIGRGVSVTHGGGGGEVIKPTFLLRDDFLTDEAAPLASPRTAEPGPGGWTVNNTTGNFEVADSLLRVETLPDSNADLWMAGDAIARQAGLGYIVGYRTNSNPGRIAFGFWSGTGGAHINNGHMFITNNGLFSSSGGGGDQRYALAVGMRYRLASILVGGSHVAVCVDDTIAWIGDNQFHDTPRVHAFTGGDAGGWDASYIRVAQLGGPWLDDFGIAADRIAGGVSAGATFSHEADCLVEWAQTALPSSGYTDVWLRRIDADNGIVVSTASDGTIELYAVESGNWSQLGFTSAGTAANGHRFVVVCDGANIRVYSNNALRITATSSVGQSATAGRIDALGTGGAVSNLVSWPRTLSGIAKQWLDAAIAD